VAGTGTYGAYNLDDYVYANAGGGVLPIGVSSSAWAQIGHEVVLDNTAGWQGASVQVTQPWHVKGKLHTDTSTVGIGPVGLTSSASADFSLMMFVKDLSYISAFNISQQVEQASLSNTGGPLADTKYINDSSSDPGRSSTLPTATGLFPGEDMVAYLYLNTNASFNPQPLTTGSGGSDFYYAGNGAYDDYQDYRFTMAPGWTLSYC
jgi:hypothetical protein